MPDPLPLYPRQVGGFTKVATASITRPADTVAYAIGDVIATATTGGDSTIEFAVGRTAAGSGVIFDAVAIDSADQATDPQLELLLFDAAPANQNDNVAFSITDAEAANFLGKITFATWTSSAGGNLIGVGVMQQPIGFKCASGGLIYGVARFLNAYTPVASEQFTFRLKVSQD